MFELTGEKIITAKIKFNENELFGKSPTNAQITCCTVTLYYTDGHVITAPASELNMEVVTLQDAEINAKKLEKETNKSDKRSH